MPLRGCGDVVHAAEARRRQRAGWDTVDGSPSPFQGAALRKIARRLTRGGGQDPHVGRISRRGLGHDVAERVCIPHGPTGRCQWLFRRGRPAFLQLEPPATTAARCRRPSKTCSGVCGCGPKPCHGTASPGNGDPSSPGVAHGLPPPPRLGGVAGFRPAPDHMAAQPAGSSHEAEPWNRARHCSGQSRAWARPDARPRRLRSNGLSSNGLSHTALPSSRSTSPSATSSLQDLRCKAA